MCCGKSRVVQTRLVQGLVKCQICNFDMYDDVSKLVQDRIKKLDIDLSGKEFAMAILLRCPSCKKENKFKVMVDNLKLKEIKELR